MRAILFLLMLSALPAQAEPLFNDLSAELPVQHEYSGGWEYFVGGGVAVFDCNGDHRPEFLVAGGTEPMRLFVNQTGAPKKPLAFVLGDFPKLTKTTGAYPLDIDGDGWMDLAVLRVGPNMLLRGGPNCRFTDATTEWGLATRDAWTTAFTATWEKHAQRPTFVFGNYVDRFDPNGPFRACDSSELIRPQGPSYGKPETISPGYCTLSMLISDWQRTGVPELRISNDRHYYVSNGYEQLFALSPLKERTENWPHVSLWGMGIASRDISGDGLPDVMLTSMGDQLLQINQGDGYKNAPYSIGTYAQRPYRGDDGRPSTGWHAQWGDIDNDGRSDLFIAKGNVDQMPSNAIHDPNNLLMQGADGIFHETAMAAKVDKDARSRGAALADFDGDGLLDLVVVNRRSPLELYQNVTPQTDHWAEVELTMAGGNRNAVGAWVEVRANGATQVQENTIGGGHAGGLAIALHFGLGDATEAEIRVIWPDGTVGAWQPLQIDQVNHIEKPHP